jgi:hypothetical protein
MKKLKITILMIILSAVTLFAADGFISYFNASSDGSKIKVEWRTNDESQIQKFEIERALKSQSYTKITTIDAKGYSSVYSYLDDEAYKESLKDASLQSTNLYSYRIKIIKKDNSGEYSNSINVSHSVSGIKRTWGMIKEMFK